MMIAPSKHRPIAQGPDVFDLLTILALGIGFVPVFQLYWVHYWALNTMNGAYSHAPIALLVFFFLAWRNRGLLRSAPDAGYALRQGYLLLICGVILKIFGEIQGYAVLRGMSLLPILYGILCIRFPRKTCRAMLYPVLFLLFIIPLPTVAIDQVTWALQRITTELAATTFTGLGYHGELNGFVMTIWDAALPSGAHDFIISQNCSGIRFLVVLFALGTLYAYLRGFKPLGQALVVVMIVPLSFLGNFCRVLLTMLLVIHVDPQTAEAFFHEFSGVVIFCVTLASLFFLEGLFSLREHRQGRGDANG